MPTRGRMQAILIPKGNLYFARKYKVLLTTGIKDTALNLSAPNQPPTGDGFMNMEKDFVSYFTTKVPSAYDLDTDQQFTGGRDIDLYTFEDTAGETDTYAYVMAGDKGWKIIDVTDPTEPAVIHTASPTCKPLTDPACRYVNPAFSYRSVAVHPDKNQKLMAMTENVNYDDGNQFGYVRFYDLSEDPGNPPIIGMERISEAYSGIPGKVALYGDYAVVNNSGTGVQIVNIQTAKKRKTGELKEDGEPFEIGEAITGGLDTIGQDFGSPNDLAIFNERSAVVTTNPGYLLTVDLNLPTDQASIDSNAPTMPVIITSFKPTGYNFTRIGVAQGYPYTDANGNGKTINLAVAGTMQGKIVTIDLTDPTNSNILNPDNIPITTSVRDISVSKDAGLAYVTTYNSIEVYDIKDPVKPRLLNKITSLPDPSGATNPDGTPVMIPIGETPAIVEKGGWVYLANMTKGFRALDLDPVVLTLKSSSIKLVKGKDASGKELPRTALNDEVYFTYTVTPETTEGFDPASSLLTVMESGTSGPIYSLPNIPTTTGMHTIQFKAKTLGKVFDEAKRYTVKIAFYAKSGYQGKPEEETARIPLEWQAIATDYNRDGKIDDTDIKAAADGNLDRKSKLVCDATTTVCNNSSDGNLFPDATNRYYFWINDNVDVDDVSGNSIPGSGSDYVNPRSTSTQSLKDGLKTNVAGKRDLVDYFPVVLDIGELLVKLPPATHTYILKQLDGAVNFVETDMMNSATRDYLTDVPTAESLESKAKFKIENNGVILENLQANKAKIILIDGRKSTSNPLVLEIKDNAHNGEIAFRSEFPLSIDGVEQMFRHINLTQSIDNPKAPARETGAIGAHKAEGGEKPRNDVSYFTNKDHFAGFEQASTDNKYAVMIHGVHNDGQDARGLQSEMFKKLYWAGSRAKFVGVSWYSDEGYSWEYYQNVVNAFATAAKLGSALKDVTKAAPVTIMAHSLGNMVVSSYLVDHHLTLMVNDRPNITGYMMLNAAVALEAYLGDYKAYAEGAGKLIEPFENNSEKSNGMVHSDWIGYEKRFGSSEWHQLFDSKDGRSKLTWRNRFADLPSGINYVNFHSTGEDVLASYAGESMQFISKLIHWDFQRNSWVLQEKWKGLPVGIAGSRHMGWGFNSTENAYKTPIVYNSDGTTSGGDFFTAAQANSSIMDNKQLFSKPLFRKEVFSGNPFMDSVLSFTNDIKPIFSELLAYALPALTTATGGWKGEKLKEERKDFESIDMNANKNDSTWPRGAKTWNHSDFKDVAFPFVYTIIEELVKKGGL